MLLTTAVGAHVIARAAALGGAPLWKGTIVDERPPDDTFILMRRANVAEVRRFRRTSLGHLTTEPQPDS